MARKRDFVDQACESWASAQREMAGRQTPVDYLGAVRCTLADRRDLHHASSSGRVEQHFPEVYSELGWCVSRAYQRMSLTLREVLYMHYVVRAPSKVKIERLGIGPRLYWDRLGRAKAYVDGWLAHLRDDETSAA